ncbi:hypothetical protein WA026_009279 [Henosepilachna vigintioctopunctata]|uniref:Uncharacterized protein n=1 Tax=Henosepilachna vigintioctopunctata TaxID=420089 RepID=A0AAW1UN92_9CUCU
MFSKIQQYEAPPKPMIREDNFTEGITTRLMMKRNLDDSRKHNLSFSSGASIPNSTIRSHKNNSSKTRNEGSGSTLNSMMSLNGVKILKDEHHEHDSSSRIALVESPLQKMRESVRRRSLSGNTGTKGSQKNASNTDSQKLSRRVSMRTDALQINGARRSTQESIREAIQNSEQQVELIDVDELSTGERKNSNSSRRNSPVRVSFQE